MRKLYTTEKWKKHSRRRQRHEETRGRIRKERTRSQRRRLIGVTPQRRIAQIARQRTTTIRAPENFCFVRNIEEMIVFVEHLKELGSKKRKLFIDLSSISWLGADAIVVLLSEIAKFDALGVPISGNAPEDPRLASMFVQSGFYDYVQAPRREPRTKGQGSIKRRESKKVDPKVAKELISFASSALYGSLRPLKGVYRALIECMNNTVDHATKAGASAERWWATVYCERDGQRANFAFVDSGIGIFKSVKLTKIASIAKLFGLKDNIDVLKAVLRGEIASRTGEPYRGKGLPSIYEAMGRGLLSKLVLITNDLYADISNNQFKILSQPFTGTFWSWEVSSGIDDAGAFGRREGVQ